MSVKQEKNIPQDSELESESLDSPEAVASEELDDPSDPSIRPIEPRCQRCGGTFSSEADLAEHVKTCRGGNDTAVRPHFH